uniref:Uncharacterized protein n=1 Tax=Piliocolobus tephrosceles TaxID=591936 RepID=A0A8C9IR84_9PRIM
MKNTVATFSEVNIKQSNLRTVQKTCLSYTDQTSGCVTIVWCSCRKNSNMLFGDIISVENMPLSDIFFPFGSGTMTVDSTEYFFPFAQS